MAYVKGYTVGGTIHIAIDNQIGFTTNPENSRSSHYCSDPAKVLATPVLHVNGDDVESCVRAADIAVRFVKLTHSKAEIQRLGSPLLRGTDDGWFVEQINVLPVLHNLKPAAKRR